MIIGRIKVVLTVVRHIGVIVLPSAKLVMLTIVVTERPLVRLMAVRHIGVTALLNVKWHIRITAETELPQAVLMDASLLGVIVLPNAKFVMRTIVVIERRLVFRLMDIVQPVIQIVLLNVRLGSVIRVM